MEHDTFYHISRRINRAYYLFFAQKQVFLRTEYSAKSKEEVNEVGAGQDAISKKNSFFTIVLLPAIKRTNRVEALFLFHRV